MREARISPDGQRIAYVTESRESSGLPERHAFLLEIPSRRTTRLGPEGSTLMEPRWSPDGRRLAGFLADRDGVQLVSFDAEGRLLGALAPVASTNHPLPGMGEALAWSPDGREIAFVSSTPGPERPIAGDPLVITRYLYKPTASEGATRLNDNRRLHVFVVDLASHRVRQLTDGATYEHSLSWSPRGDELLFLSNHEPDSDRVFNYDIFAVRVADGRLRRLTSTGSAEYGPAWSPDGSRVAFVATRRPLTSSETTMEDTHLATIAADGGDRRQPGDALDNRQSDPAWSSDGRFVYVSVEERGSQRLYRIPAAGGPAQPVVPAAHDAGVVRSWSAAADGRVACALARAEHPPELFLLDSTSAPARLTELSRGLLGQRSLAPVESFRFPSFDGLEVEAFLTRPLPSEAAGKRPLIVVLHGGPHGQQGPAFDFKAQVYAAQGWATLMVNYRGSTGYGQKLADAIYGDQDGGEARDVLAAVDAALTRYPWLDASRMGLEGGSYGGQLTNWIVTQSDRFRAAISIAGIANLVSFNYTAYYHDYLAVEFGAFPHQGDLMDRLFQRSPLRHVARVKTPVLLLHGENDNDVPVTEAEQFFVALKDVGVETVFVRYPREGHGLRETGHLIDALNRSIDWYRGHFL